jgi:hypothetical protein
MFFSDECKVTRIDRMQSGTAYYYVTLLYSTKSYTLVNSDHRARRGAFGNDVQFGFLSFAVWLVVASIFVR